VPVLIWSFVLVQVKLEVALFAKSFRLIPESQLEFLLILVKLSEDPDLSLKMIWQDEMT